MYIYIHVYFILVSNIDMPSRKQTKTSKIHHDYYRCVHSLVAMFTEGIRRQDYSCEVTLFFCLQRYPLDISECLE